MASLTQINSIVALANIHSRNAPILAPEELMSRVCTRISATGDRYWGTLSPTTIFVRSTLRLSNVFVSVLSGIPVAVRRERRWTTAGDKPARELYRSTR